MQIASARREVQQRFRAVNGDHPLTAADDAYLAEHFVEVPGHLLVEMATGAAPLAPYLRSDGTPMMPASLEETLEWAGGVPGLEAWFRDWYAEDEVADFEEDWDGYLRGQWGCLKTPRPGQMRRTRQFLAQAEAAAARLRTEPQDHLARGSLGEAVGQLDDLLLPETDYDRLRFGRPPLRQQWVDDVTAELLSPAAPPLPVRTERLVLRQPTVEDTDDAYAYLSRPDVCEYLLRGPFTRGEVAAELRRRADNPPSHLSLVIEHEGTVIGDLVLFLEKPGYDKAEIGWVIHPEYAGRGLATEAARALIDLAFSHYGVHRVRAELDARNLRSAALAARLGMRQEGLFHQDFWAKGEWTDTPHYAVLATEWPPPRT
jgi:RimJ/RimL family protein N-acetyltransferase